MLETHTLTGKLIIESGNTSLVNLNKKSEMPCSGDNNSESGGVGDLSARMQVTVRDGANKIIAVGSLEKSKVIKNQGHNLCEFPIKVENVPNSDFYSIGLGHRGYLIYSAKEMADKRWFIQFRLNAFVDCKVAPFCS